MEEKQKTIHNIILNINNTIKNRNSGTFLSSFKLLFFKHIEITEDVHHRVGKDDRHESTQTITYSFEDLSEYPISAELSSKIQNSLNALRDFETSSSYYYGGKNSHSFVNKMLLEKSRLINHQLDKYSSSELLTEHRINRILFHFIQDFNNHNRFIEETPGKYVHKWYIYVTAMKTLIYLIFNEKAKNTNYQNLNIYDVIFWNELLSYTKSIFNDSFVGLLDRIYIDNKLVIDDFINQKIDDLHFEKTIKELLVSTIEEISILKSGIVINKFHKYYN